MVKKHIILGTGGLVIWGICYLLCGLYGSIVSIPLAFLWGFNADRIMGWDKP